MSTRPKFIDDLAGVAGGALSAFAGLRDEIEAAVRARVDEVTRKLDLVTRAEFDAIAELAANARGAQEAAEAKLAELEARLAALEGRPIPMPGPDAIGTTSVPPPGDVFLA